MYVRSLQKLHMRVNMKAAFLKLYDLNLSRYNFEHFEDVTNYGHRFCIVENASTLIGFIIFQVYLIIIFFRLWDHD